MSLGSIFPDKFVQTKILAELSIKLLDIGLSLKPGRETGEKDEKARFDPKKPWLLSNILTHGQPGSNSASCSPTCGRRKPCSNLFQSGTSEQDSQFQVGLNMAGLALDTDWL